MTDTPTVLGERDLLVRHLRALEEECAEAGESAALRKEVRQCRGALSWIDRREAGEREFAWGPRGVARLTIIGLGLVGLSALAFGPSPFAWWRLAAQLGIWLAFGVGGGIWLSRYQWRLSQDAFEKQVALASEPPAAASSTSITAT